MARYTVFISHSSKDRWIARQIARFVEERGAQTFLDEKDIHGGDFISQTIKESIRDCDELLVLMSQYSIDRPWVLIEIGAAWALDKPVVPIIDKVTPGQMPDILSDHKAIDLNDLNDYLAELEARVSEATP